MLTELNLKSSTVNRLYLFDLILYHYIPELRNYFLPMIQNNSCVQTVSLRRVLSHTSYSCLSGSLFSRQDYFPHFLHEKAKTDTLNNLSKVILTTERLGSNQIFLLFQTFHNLTLPHHNSLIHFHSFIHSFIHFPSETLATHWAPGIKSI